MAGTVVVCSVMPVCALPAVSVSVLMQCGRPLFRLTLWQTLAQLTEFAGK